MFIDSIPTELKNKRWIEVSEPYLEIDKGGPDATGMLMPELWINTHLPLYYRFVVVEIEGIRHLVIETEDYDQKRTASQFPVDNIKEMVVTGGTTNAHGELAPWGRVTFEMKDGTGHRFSFTDRANAEGFLMDIKGFIKPLSYKDVLLHGR